MPCGICGKNIYYFVIGKTYRIDNYEMTNVFYMFGHLLTNINYTAVQTQKHKGQWNLISCAGSQNIPDRIESKSQHDHQNI